MNGTVYFQWMNGPADSVANSNNSFISFLEFFAVGSGDGGGKRDAYTLPFASFAVSRLPAFEE